MNRIRFYLIALAIACAGIAAQGAAAADQNELLIASTIGPIDSGIMPALEQAFEKDTGIIVRHVGAGTSAALKLARSCNFDAALVHAPALEKKFIEDGFGVKRVVVMYNDFIILGPAADPAGIKGMPSAAAAFRKIADGKALFVTRGDRSGTHVKEMDVWEKAGIKPSGAWYEKYEKGSEGNARTVAYASSKQAYILMDRATYLTMKKELKIVPLVEKDEILLNFISIIAVNPARCPKVNAAGAERLVKWMKQDRARNLIKDFGRELFGGPLYFPVSD
jgi:tungstate transport system substrate-binding protein